MIHSRVLTYGFRFFFGVALLSVVGAFVFALSGDQGVIDNVLGPLTLGWKGGVGSHVGYAVLIGTAVASGGLAAILVAFRDADAEAQAQAIQVESLPLTRPSTGASFAPVVAALLVVAMIVGLAASPGLFQASVFGLVAVAAVWTVRAWANRATGDDRTNAELYHRVIDPLRVPVGSALVVAFVVLGLSRVLLALPKAGSVAVFAVAAAVFFGLAILLATRPRMNQNVLTLVVLALAVAILAGAIVGVVAGQREFHHAEPGAEHGTEAGAEASNEEGAAGVPVVAPGASS